MSIERAAPHGWSQLWLCGSDSRSRTGASGAHGWSEGESEGGNGPGGGDHHPTARRLAQTILGLVKGLRTRGLAVPALDAALVAASPEWAALTGGGEAAGEPGARVTFALRGCFASGAEYKSVEEAGHARADDNGEWSAALGGVLKELGVD
mmetsp:Transcript_51945/g.173377  ORF Transcript_51945/g.173377 Transcript_51945/m.173377 type:complete len:151 (+) Transcript_51945:1-453(+)